MWTPFKKRLKQPQKTKQKPKRGRKIKSYKFSSHHYEWECGVYNALLSFDIKFARAHCITPIQTVILAKFTYHLKYTLHWFLMKNQDEIASWLKQTGKGKNETKKLCTFIRSTLMSSVKFRQREATHNSFFHVQCTCAVHILISLRKLYLLLPIVTQITAQKKHNNNHHFAGKVVDNFRFPYQITN